MDDWKDTKKENFCFFGKKLNIIKRYHGNNNIDYRNAVFIACCKGFEICIAAQFNSIWIIVYVYNRLFNTKRRRKFHSPTAAFDKFFNDIGAQLVEANI